MWRRQPKVQIKVLSQTERKPFDTLAGVDDATIKQLRSLVATARGGSIAAAARALHITAPAVGQQIQLLERSAGVPLLVRTPSGVRPTDAGEILLRTANNIEVELESCRQVLDQLAAGRTGHVTLGAVSTAKYFAPHLLAAFWREHPDIEVTLLIGNRDETLGNLERSDVDVCIMGRPPETIPLETHVIGPNPHVVIASPVHPLCGNTGIRLRRLADEVFLMRERGSGTRTLTESMLASARLAPKIGMEIASNETIKQAVMADLGIALLSAHTVAAEVADGRLAVLDVAGTPLIREWHVVHHAHAQQTPAASALWEFVVERCRDVLPDS